MDPIREAYIRGRNDEAQVIMNWLNHCIADAQTEALRSGVANPYSIATLLAVLQYVNDPTTTPNIPKNPAQDGVES